MSFHEGSPADGWANARLLHGKVHSAPTRLRKDALCDPRVAQTALFPSRCGVREVWDNRPPGCGVPWKIAQLGKCVRATARQAAGRVAQGSANLSLKAMSGNNVAHSNVRTRRKFNVNLFAKKFYWVEQDCWVTLNVSAAGLRLINKIGLDAAIKNAAAQGFLS